MSIQNKHKKADMENRIEWVDYAKAFGIWLVVFAHTNLSSSTLVYVIMTFHMPMFFLLSGYFDKGNGISVSNLLKNVKCLIVPYFIYSIFGLSICWTFPYAHPELYFGLHDIGEIILAAIKGMFIMEDKVQQGSFMPLGCLWFLPALFFCKLFWAIFISFFFKSKWLVIFPMLICLWICYNRPNYFSVDSAVYALPFYGLGYMMKIRGWMTRFPKNHIVNAIVVILLIMYLFFIGVENGRVDLNACSFGQNLGMYYFNAIIGSMACVIISLMLPKWGFLSEVGRNSLSILALHPYVILLSKVVAVYCFSVDMRNFPIWGSALVACVSCVFIVWIKRYFAIYGWQKVIRF